MTACNTKTVETKTETTETIVKEVPAEPAPVVEKKESGSVEVNKEGVTVKGNAGGSFEVNQNGVKIEGKDPK
jgi:hypothetical protein